MTTYSSSRRNRKAKIIATLGPASEPPEMIERLLKAGVDVIRLNLSHGRLDAHRLAIGAVREVSSRLGLNTGVLLDLQGPRIRTGEVPEGGLEVKDGDAITLVSDGPDPAGVFVRTTYHGLAGDVRPGDRILIDDGLIELSVVDKTDVLVNCSVVHGGTIRSHKGMNLPGVPVSAPSLTPKDIEGIALGMEMEVDFLALSFVRRPEDIVSLKEMLAERGADIPIIAKIERAEAVEDLSGILKVSDGVMIARGDLGVELSPERVPVLQKKIIREAAKAEKIVITATQMLDSMVKNPRPTRAEASDVANAVFDGTDALMLSGETAVGSYPVKAVEMMGRIVREAEAADEQDRRMRRRREGAPPTFAHMIGYAACAASTEENSRAIVVFTQTGDTALIVSKLRPKTQIVAFTPLEKTARKLSLMWGVRPARIEFGGHTDEMICRGEAALLDMGLAEWGDTVIIVSGTRVGMRGATNMMKIDWIGSDECRLYLKGEKNQG